MFKTIKFLKKNFSKNIQKLSNFDYNNRVENDFERYHLPFTQEENQKMLNTLGFRQMDDFINQVIAKDMRSNSYPDLVFPKVSMQDALNKFKNIIDQNKRFTSYIGQGFYPTNVPSLIKRCILENPAWYTAYTPYQPEISQGRLEAVFNFQLLVARLTKMDFANGSLLDEASAAGESVLMAWRIAKKKKNTVLVSKDIFQASIELIKAYCEELNINVIVDDINQTLIEENKKDCFAVVLQSPDRNGVLNDFTDLISNVKGFKATAIVGSDLMANVISKPPGEMGADIVYGNAQRLGVPMGFGGPHAAFFATKLKHVRQAPGRIIAISKDKHGKKAYRISVTTREQHIRREKATSNICTSQVLLANMNFFYVLFHGEEGIRSIAQKISYLTQNFASLMRDNNIEIVNDNGVNYFDTVQIKVDAREMHNYLLEKGINSWFVNDNCLSLSLDETKTKEDILLLANLITKKNNSLNENFKVQEINENVRRENTPIFKETDIISKIKGELEITRYITRLQNKDVTLCNSMIPLGSCTMKLNAAYQLEYLSHPQMDLHPFVPSNQSEGYNYFISELARHLLNITEMDAVTFQSNSGATGEYVGLSCIKKYHESKGDHHRDVVLIPSSAHGTNPASAAKMGLKIVDIKTTKTGYVDLQDLEKKIAQNKENIFGLMLTYPSTFGVFEENTVELVNMVRNAGGRIYIDGANMNAHFFLTSPGHIGDVCHLNLHKSFCIPHGGGGPGHGPVLVKDILAPFLPSHCHTNKTAFNKNGVFESNGPMISNSVYSSASILSISYLFMLCSGNSTMKKSSQQAILNSNYLRKLIEDHYHVRFSNQKGFGAHEFIIDMIHIKKETGVTEEDVAKRLMDYGFHAPTQSFPIAGTLMIEPTESENIQELERYAQALVSIKSEINKIKTGEYDKNDNPLKNAPHSQEYLLSNEWNHCYSREIAAYPLEYIRERGKVWPCVGRIDGTFGDRNLKLDYD